jgi:Flp pilus assembly protein TadD
MTSAIRIILDAGHRISPDPASADRCRLAAVALQKQGRIDDAISLYLRGLAWSPFDAAGYRCLGTAYKSRGKLDLAVICFRKALELCPSFPEAWNNLGNTLSELNDVEGAAECFRRAFTVQPDFAGAHFNYGQALARLGRFDEAIAAYQRAIALAPRSAEFYNGLGIALFDCQRVDEALAAYDRAIAIRPDLASARYNRSLAWLLQGDFQRGWPEYEWRWKHSAASVPSFPQPRWDGRCLPDGTILLVAEQGIGDTLQFVRYASLVKERVGTVILLCQKPLRLLLKSVPCVDRLICEGDPIPQCDCWCPLLSLPLFFTPTVDDVPRMIPYLAADETLVRFWQWRMQHVDGFRVGINWQGNPAFLKDRFRSIPLAAFEPLAKIPGVRLISLQKGPGSEQLQQQSAKVPVIDLGLKLDEIHGPFLDTAAILRCLDLVVTSDTSLAHLAGAMGIETWVAVPSVPEWRWLLGREETPWYPTLRLFRQSHAGVWSDVFTRIAAALRKRIVIPFAGEVSPVVKVTLI